MSRLRAAIAWIGRTALGIAGLTVGVAVLIGGGFYVMSDTMPAIGVVEVLLPAVLVGGGILVWLLAKLALRILGDGEEADRADTRETVGAEAAATDGEPSSPGSRQPVRQFWRANFYVAVVFGGLLGISVGSASVQTLLAGTPLGILGGFLLFAAQVTGGTPVHAVNVLVFGGAWWGLRRHEAKEGWLLGMVGWGLVVISGLGLLSRSLGAIAIVVGGLKVLSVGYEARESTEWLFLDEQLGALTAEVSGPTQPESPSGSPETARGPEAGEIAAAKAALSERDLRSPRDLWALLDVDPVFVDPREADDQRLTYWCTLSYLLGGLTLLSTLLIGVQLWGFPVLGLWGIPVGLLYLVHGFGLPQGSPVIHAGGLVLYGLTLLHAIVTVSPLAMLGAGAGLYLGWSATRDLQSPASLFEAGGASESGLRGRFRDGGLFAGIALGGILGLIGAAAFAWISVETRTVYGLALLVPPIAAGCGVAVGLDDTAPRLKGLVAAGVATASVVIALRLLTSMMPRGYELQPEPLLAIGPLVGIYGAYKIAANSQERPDGKTKSTASTAETPTESSGSEGA